MGTAGKGEGKGPLRIMLGRCKAFTEEGFLPMEHRKKARCRYVVFGVDWEAIKMMLVFPPPQPPHLIPKNKIIWKLAYLKEAERAVCHVEFFNHIEEV